MASKLSYYLDVGRRVPLRGAAPKLWNYVKYRLTEKRVVTRTRSFTPQIASLMLTKRCNLSCAYCSVGNIINQPGPSWREGEATLAKVRRIFANPLFSNCLLVDLLGGEPLLVKELEAIVGFLAGRGHVVNMATNGINLIARIEGLKRAGIARINVSLYEENRAALSRELPMINRVFPVHASLVLRRSDLAVSHEHLLERARAARDAGCKSLRFYVYRPMGVVPNPNEVIDDATPSYRAFREKVTRALPGFVLWPATTPAERVEKRCPQLWQRIGCDATGRLAICCGTDRFLSGRNGNLFDGPPDVVFNHPTLVGMRRQLLEPRSPPPDICKTCNLLGEPGW